MAEITNTSDIISNPSLSLDLSNSTIETDEENSSQLKFPNSEFPTNTSISVKSSSDVVIGNVTQFHGPVTIYQNTTNNTEIEKTGIDNETTCANSQTKLVAAETFAGKPLSKLTKPINKAVLIWTSILLSLIIICISIIVVLYLQGNTSNEDHQLIPRSKWGGRPPLYTRKLHQPTKYVIISHTASQYCKTIEDCSRIVAQIQSQHVSELDSPDIGYNFLVGGDENIYIGRGWDAENFHMSDSVGISFIGNYIYDRLTPGMTQATQQLLTSGLNQSKLDQDYKLIAHNQTWNTLSPGTNIYNAIRFWPHYSPELVPITP